MNPFLADKGSKNKTKLLKNDYFVIILIFLRADANAAMSKAEAKAAADKAAKEAASNL